MLMQTQQKLWQIVRQICYHVVTDCSKFARMVWGEHLELSVLSRRVVLGFRKRALVILGLSECNKRILATFRPSWTQRDHFTILASNFAVLFFMRPSVRILSVSFGQKEPVEWIIVWFQCLRFCVVENELEDNSAAYHNLAQNSYILFKMQTYWVKVYPILNLNIYLTFC